MPFPRSTANRSPVQLLDLMFAGVRRIWHSQDWLMTDQWVARSPGTDARRLRELAPGQRLHEVTPDVADVAARICTPTNDGRTYTRTGLTLDLHEDTGLPSLFARVYAGPDGFVLVSDGWAQTLQDPPELQPSVYEGAGGTADGGPEFLTNGVIAVRRLVLPDVVTGLLAVCARLVQSGPHLRLVPTDSPAPEPSPEPVAKKRSSGSPRKRATKK